ncbi:hypothetical protein Hanom_Chr11g01029111 [Helianthus anomalus]
MINGGLLRMGDISRSLQPGLLSLLLDEQTLETGGDLSLIPSRNTCTDCTTSMAACVICFALKPPPSWSTCGGDSSCISRSIGSSTPCIIMQESNYKINMLHVSK